VRDVFSLLRVLFREKLNLKSFRQFERLKLLEDHGFHNLDIKSFKPFNGRSICELLKEILCIPSLEIRTIKGLKV